MPRASEPPARDAKKSRGARILAVQVVLTVLAFAYLLSKTEPDKLFESFRSLPWWSVPAGVATLSCVMFAGAIRWRLLLAAYGARGSMPILRLFKLQLIGLFYNLMPGAVGGDVIRGLVSRDAFGDRVSAGLAVVLVERVMGLIGLMLLVVCVLAMHPIHNLELSPWVFAVGALACVGALVGIALARRFAGFLPRVVAKQLSNLPELSNLGAFGFALLVSVANQALVGVMGHLAIAPLAPQVELIDSLALAPLAFAAIFFPLTVAGAGTRDQAMIALYGMLGVPRTAALSASVQILICYLLVSALGGVLGMLSPLQVDMRASGLASSE